MTTVSGSFSAEGISNVLRIRKTPRDVTFSISGTYNGYVVIEQATTTAELSWKPVTVPYYSGGGSGKIALEPQGRLRFRSIGQTTGSAVYSMSDADAIYVDERNPNNERVAGRTEGGDYVVGDMYVGGSLFVGEPPEELTPPGDASETNKGIVELATDLEAAAGADTTRAVTPANLAAAVPGHVPDASASTKGKVELALDAEAVTGTDTTRAVTPANLAAAVTTHVAAATTTTAGKSELATDAEAIAGADTTRTITPASLAATLAAYVPAASETVAGKVELATNAETITGSDTVRATTPAGVAAAIAAAGSGLAAADQSTTDTGTSITTGVTPSGLRNVAWHGADLENRIFNPEGAILQRSSAGTTDNSYTVDRWRLLLEAANAATVSQVTSSLPTQAQYAIRLTAGSGNNNKFGLWQVIEGINCRDMTGQKVYLTFQAKATSGLSNIKAGIVEFTGTEDSVSGDPISSWGADGTTPTLAANYAFLNTPANLSVGTSYAQITTIAVTVGSSMKNLAVFIWNDDKTTTQTTDQLEVTMIELRHGAGAIPYRARPLTIEQLLCCRYYWRMLQTGSGNTVLGSGYNTSTTNARLGIRLPVPARTTPTVGGGGGGLYVSDTASGTVNSSAAAIFGTTAGLAMVNVDITTSGSLTSGAPCSAFFNTAIDLTFSMEL
jgi:hypothetical protein